MTAIDGLGFAAATLTTIAFLPQVFKTWQSRSAKDLSVGMIVLFMTGLFLWLIYGISLKALPIIVANAVTLGLNGMILGLKLKYER